MITKLEDDQREHRLIQPFIYKLHKHRFKDFKFEISTKNM